MSAEVASQWLDGMLSVSLQFTVLVGVVALLLAVLRPLTPRVRYLVWLIVLLRLALPAGITSRSESCRHPPHQRESWIPTVGYAQRRKRLPGRLLPKKPLPAQPEIILTGASTPLRVFTAWLAS